ncbi:MAG TPA: TIGR02266 family protein [Polyangiaceae bacterium]|nr:TIGR02266 family protein [Polyangiaceae bacterium]
MDVEDTWLEVDDSGPRERDPAHLVDHSVRFEPPPTPELERLLRQQQLELERLRSESARRIEAAERERDAALAAAEALRASLQPAVRHSQRPAHAKPPTATPAPHSDDPAQSRREIGKVPTLSDVLVATEPLGKEPGLVEPDERRNEPRTSKQFEVEFNYETHFFAGLTLDISSGGLFIATYHLLPVGTALSLSFQLPQLPDGLRLSVRGEVRWVRCASEGHERPGMGVAFKELTADTLSAIAAFCAERPPLYMDL